jgi:hypothetical protein
MQLPETGYLRLPQILGSIKDGIPPIFPVSRSSWYLGIKSGRYPKPVKIGSRSSAWAVESI